MSFMEKHKSKITIAFCIIAVLLISFFCTGDNTEIQQYIPATNADEEIGEVQNEVVSVPEAEESAKEEYEKTVDTHGKIEEEKPATVPIPVQEIIAEEKEPEKPLEKIVENQTVNGHFNCTLSVRCDKAIGKTMEKEGVVPENGIIFPEQKVVFYDGESVFNVLVREMKKNNIHMEFVDVPLYNSAYIEGIDNLYDFDCGELSGWMYKVNGWFPNYGCSSYQLKDGDRIEFVYTCDLGVDVGGSYSARNGR